MSSQTVSSTALMAPVGTTIVSNLYSPSAQRADTCTLHARPPTDIAHLQVPAYASLLAARPPEPPAPTPLPPLRTALRTRAWQGCKLAAVGLGAVTAGLAAGHMLSNDLAAAVAGVTVGFAAAVQIKNHLFGLRHDGRPIEQATLVRRLMPILLRTRQEGSVVHEQVLHVHKSLAFVEAWNATHAHKITVFHLILAAICRSADVRPGLDRFTIGGRTYQRLDSSLSFVVKRTFKDYAGLRTVKFRAEPHESLESLTQRMHVAINTERHARDLRPVEKETRFFVNLPGWLLSVGMAAQRFLDHHGMLPAVATHDDPMYTSVFAANLGSLGLDRVSHHLYDYGTASLFAAVGKVRNDWWVHRRQVSEHAVQEVSSVVPTLSVFWTFDERINDGHYCAAALEHIKDLVENPERMLDTRDAADIRANLQRDQHAGRAAVQQESAA